MTDFEQYPDDEPEYKSKTQIKREAEALQKLGTVLIDLSDSQFAQVPMGERLQAAILEAKRIKSKSREGLRRQMQFIGKLMRSEDHEAIEAKLTEFREKDRHHTHQFHQAEQWRDQLLVDTNAAFNELTASYPDIDRQHINQLVRQAQKEQSQGKPPAHARKLFRYLRDIIEQANAE